MPFSRNLASDNTAGICPEAWEALAEANSGDAPAYGNDRWTAEACDLFREIFETPCEVFFTFNGTAANSLALASLCRSYHAVVCHELAHVETDECGAPEFYSGGSKLLLARGAEGRIDPASVEQLLSKRRDLHFPKPKVLSLTNATECGTVYTPAEMQRLGALASGLAMNVHLDGARFANAIAELGCAPKDLTWRAGVDVLCFGGSKNGLAVGEAVVFFDRELAREFEYRCKQAGQLASKMRYLSAPWVGLLRDGAWLRHAAHANACAARLDAGLRALPGVNVLFPRQANSVFAEFPKPVAAALRRQGWLFYDFIAVSAVRLMCSWSTTEAAIDAFLAEIAVQLQQHAAEPARP